MEHNAAAKRTSVLPMNTQTHIEADDKHISLPALVKTNNDCKKLHNFRQSVKQNRILKEKTEIY